MRAVEAEAYVVALVRGDAPPERSRGSVSVRKRRRESEGRGSERSASGEAGSGAGERTPSAVGTNASRVMTQDSRACAGTGADARAMATLSDGDEAALADYARAMSAERARRSQSRIERDSGAVGGLDDEPSIAPRLMRVEKRRDLGFWGVPDIAREVLQAKGVRELYEWQTDCLSLPGVLDGSSNLLYSAPTSGGKSLVADVLLMRRFRERPGSIAMVVLPFVALCEERADSFERLFSGTEIRVRRMFGGRGGAIPNDQKANTLLVLTPERANQVTSRLLEEKRLHEISIVVVDELHLIQDEARGATMELLLTKLVYSSGLWRRKPGDDVEENALDDTSQTTYSVGRTRRGVRDQRTTQIVGMSASIPNLTSLAEWLSAQLFVTDVRPVKLEICVKSGHEIFDAQSRRVIRTMMNTAPNSDVAHIAELCQETVDEGGSVLVFCSARKACKTTADDLQKMMRCDEAFYNDPSRISAISNIESLLGEKSDVPGYVKTGIAYHHAALSREEQDAVATAYKCGLIRVLCCTSTLAAGVNLPARRVILRDTNMGAKKLAARDIQQMCGRAGRAGLDTSGSAFVFCSNRSELENVFTLVSGPLEELTSVVAEAGMRRIMLEAVASGLVKTPADVQAYVKCTLLSALKNFNEAVKQIAIDALQWCQRNGLLVWNATTFLWSSSPLGNAVAGGMMPLDQIQPIIKDIKAAREDLVLSTPLHLLFLLTAPPVVNEEGAVLNLRESSSLQIFASVWSSMSAEYLRVAEKVGVSEQYIQRLRSNNRDKTNEHRLQRFTCQRFHLALAMTDLIQEVPMQQIVARYGINSYDILEEQKACARFASYIAAVCGTLGFGDMEFLINKISDRITAGAQEEILELTKIPQIGIARARALYTGGLTTPKAIVTLGSVDKLAAVLMQYSKNMTNYSAVCKAARSILARAREIVAEQTREEREEAEIKLAAMQQMEAEMAMDNLEDDTVEVDGASGIVLLNNTGAIEQFLQRWETSMEYAVVFQPKSDVDAFRPRRVFEEPTRIAVAFDSKAVFIAKILYERHEEMRHEVFGIRLSRVLEILSTQGPKKFTIDLQSQLCSIVGNRATKFSERLFSFASPCVDVRIAAWLLRPSAPEVKSSDRDSLVQGVDPTEPLMNLFCDELDVAKDGIEAASRFHSLKQRGSLEHLQCLSRAAATCYVMGRFMWEECERMDLLRALMEVEMPFVAPIVAMETVKIPFDAHKLREQIALMDDRLRRLEEHAKKERWIDDAHPEPLRTAFTENAYLAKCLYEHLKLTPPPGSALPLTKTGKTRKGEFSIDAGNLRELHEQSGHAFPLLIMEHRSVYKRRTFADTLLSMYGGAADGRIRYFIYQTNHDCGRLANTEPNFHSLPHDMKCGEGFHGIDSPLISVRSAFVPPADKMFLRVDYSHLELRIMAHFSGDQALTHLLQSAEPAGASDDPFTMLASKWRGISLDAVSAEERSRVKNLVYGILYGSGVKRLARELQVSEDDAKQRVNELKSMLPRLMQWKDEIVVRAREEKPVARVTTICRRHRYFPDLLSKNADERAQAERQAVNTVCQGSAADIFKTAIILVTETLRSKHLLDRCQLVLTVHDEAVFEVNANCAKAAAHVVRNAMESVAERFKLSVPLPVKVQLGPSLGDATFSVVERQPLSGRPSAANTPAASPLKPPKR